ncbi:hypothetical protein FB461_2086, partial [Rarobacter faecitabidus]
MRVSSLANFVPASMRNSTGNVDTAAATADPISAA